MDEWVSHSCDTLRDLVLEFVCLAQHLCDGFWFVLLYFICYAMLIAPECPFLSNERQKGMDSGRRGAGEELGGEEGGKTIIRICFMRTGTISITEKNKVTR